MRTKIMSVPVFLLGGAVLLSACTTNIGRSPERETVVMPQTTTIQPVPVAPAQPDVLVVPRGSTVVPMR
jgi:hypothetical protein